VIVVDVVQAAAGGDRLEALRAVRDRLADELDQAQGRDVAPIARELRAVLDALESAEPVKGGSRFDELAARRAGRLADAAGDDRAAGGRDSR